MGFSFVPGKASHDLHFSPVIELPRLLRDIGLVNININTTCKNQRCLFHLTSLQTRHSVSGAASSIHTCPLGSHLQPRLATRDFEISIMNTSRHASHGGVAGSTSVNAQRRDLGLDTRTRIATVDEFDRQYRDIKPGDEGKIRRRDVASPNDSVLNAWTCK